MHNQNQTSSELHALRAQLYSAIGKAQDATAARKAAEISRTQPERAAEDLAKAEVARLNSEYQQLARVELRGMT